MGKKTESTPVAEGDAPAVVEKKVAKKMVGKSKVAKRHAQTEVKPGVEGITNPAIRRIARRGGVKRTSLDTFPESRKIVQEFLEQIVSNAVIVSRATGKKTVTVGDVQYALQRNGRTLYGTSI